MLDGRAAVRLFRAHESPVSHIVSFVGITFERGIAIDGGGAVHLRGGAQSSIVICAFLDHTTDVSEVPSVAVSFEHFNEYMPA